MKIEKSALGAVVALTILIFSTSAFLVFSEISSRYDRHISIYKDSGWMFTDLERKLNALEAAYHDFKDNPDGKTSSRALTKALDAFDRQLTASLAVSKFNPVMNEPAIRNFITRIQSLQNDFRSDLGNFSPGNQAQDMHLDEHMAFLKTAIQGITTKILINDLSQMKPGETQAYDTRLFLLFIVMAASGAGLTGFLLQQTLRSEKLAIAAQQTEKILSSRLAAIEAASDGIGIVDREGRLVYMNAALARLHAIGDPKAYLGKPMRSLYTPKGQTALDTKVLPLLREHGNWRGESPIVQLNGNVIHTELSLTLLPDGSMIGTARDITDRKKAETEQKSLQEQFYQAQKMEALGRLAGGIAHDFNNILAAIVGYAEFLTEDLNENSEQHRFASRILKAGQKAQDLVEQILAFSRKNRATRESISPADIVNEIVALLEPVLPQTISLKKAIQSRHAQIYANNSQINQVLMNLCVNAVDAMEGGTGSLEISLYAPGRAEMENLALPEGASNETETLALRISEDNGVFARLVAGHVNPEKSYCCISISDTGTGISRDLMEKIFEPFFTTKEAGKGTGLGLSAVLGIIAAHDGCLALESRIGAGSRFNIYLPATQEKAEPSKKRSGDADKPLGSETIMIVDDELDVGDMLVNAFSRLGYDTIYCRSGNDAMELLGNDPDICDIVVSDYSMPGMNGVELAEAVYNLGKGTPVIVLTGFAGRAVEEFLSCPGVRGAFKKPVEIREISRFVRNVLDQRKS